MSDLTDPIMREAECLRLKWELERAVTRVAELETEREEFFLKDSGKTREINILVKEVRSVVAERDGARAEASAAKWERDDWRTRAGGAAVVEREACARVAELCLPALHCPPWADAQRTIAKQIRARGGK